MQKKLLRILGLLILLNNIFPASGQEVVRIVDSIPQQFFTFKQIEVLKDPQNTLTFEQVKGHYSNKFIPSAVNMPNTDKLNETYWLRIRIQHNAAATNHFLLEFFDQTIDHLTLFIPDTSGGYEKKEMGDVLPFNARTLEHKNFEVFLKNDNNQVLTYYFKIRSSQISAGIIVLRSYNWFTFYSLKEYFFFGIYYGMIVVFSFYNLMMFIAMRQRHYIYYVLYILSVALFEMSSDGIAYQYLWPDSPAWNQIAFSVALCLVSVFALLFTKDFLNLKVLSPKLNKIVTAVVVLRILYLLFSLFFARDLITYKFVDFIPLAVAFYSGLYALHKKYIPARFFVLGYTCLFIGFMIKVAIMLYFQELNHHAIGYYSLSFCFVLEMIFLSFAIGDKVSILRTEKEDAQNEIFHQMAENSRLKDEINQELEQKVNERTREVLHKSIIIEAKNEELLEVNDLLREQATEIARMNILLEQDNQELQHNVEKVTMDRVMSADVDFEEFSKIYPDKDHCNQFLSDLKWKNGYSCKRCKHTSYYAGHVPLSRRCAKCNYQESVTTDTIFHNTRIPINKAFYMVFLIYSSKGKISSHKLAEVLGIRQSTCWTFGTRIKQVMENKKSVLKKSNKNGWSQLIFD